MTKKTTKNNSTKPAKPINESNKKAVKGSYVTDESIKRSTTTTTGSGGPRKK